MGRTIVIAAVVSGLLGAISAVGCGGKVTFDGLPGQGGASGSSTPSASSGEDDCQLALMHVQMCVGSTGTSALGSCTGTIDCEAKCINAASCSDILSSDPNNPYIQCLAACGA